MQEQDTRCKKSILQCLCNKHVLFPCHCEARRPWQLCISESRGKVYFDMTERQHNLCRRHESRTLLSDLSLRGRKAVAIAAKREKRQRLRGHFRATRQSRAKPWIQEYGKLFSVFSYRNQVKLNSVSPVSSSRSEWELSQKKVVPSRGNNFFHSAY